MRIQNNITAVNSHRQYGINVGNISKTTERLSSGLRVNRAADDAAGLAISEKMRTQIRGLNRASLNIQDGVSLLRVGDGVLQTVHDKIQRMRELAVQAANDTNELLDRKAIQLEIGQLTSEINDTIVQAQFNQKTLFDGSIGASWAWHLGLRTTPMLHDPAIITAGNDFQEGIIAGGTQAIQNVLPASTHLDALNGPPANFPLEGIFVIRAQIPGETMRAAVLDFGELNTDGNFNLDDFRTFYENAFADWIAADELVVNITDAGQIEVRTTGVGGNQSHVTIGATSGIGVPTGMGVVFANSAIFGATAASATSTASFRVTSGAVRISPAELAAINASPSTSTHLWDLIPDTTFTWQAQEWTHDPVRGPATSSWNYTGPAVLHTETMTKAQLVARAAADGHTVTNFAQANTWLATQGDGANLGNLTL